MLVLTRKCTESIRIGRDIRLTVVRLGSGQVRLGIEAPAQVSVLREELMSRSPAGVPVARARRV